jgi:hypothetical protein
VEKQKSILFNQSKTYLGIFFISIVIILFATLFVFNKIQNSNISLTGFAAYDMDNFSDSNLTSNETVLISQEEAEIAINNSIAIIENMGKNGFSIDFVNDTLYQARRVYQQAIYASILRNLSSTYDQKSNASLALRLIDWSNITFNDVLFYTEKISSRQKEAYVIYDSLNILSNRISSSSEQGINISYAQELYNESLNAFFEDRYKDAQNLIIQANSDLEKKGTEYFTFRSLASGTLNFFQKYWALILVVVLFSIPLIRFFLRKITKRKTENQIKKMKTEFKVLENLIIQTQKQRFKQNSISGVVYNIRVNKYKLRQEQIKELLPVLEEKLNKLK